MDDLKEEQASMCMHSFAAAITFAVGGMTKPASSLRMFLLHSVDYGGDAFHVFVF